MKAFRWIEGVSLKKYMGVQRVRPSRMILGWWGYGVHRCDKAR